MQHFILLTRLISEEVHPSFCIDKKARTVKEKILQYCPTVIWVSNYALLGGWNYLDIFQALDMETALKVSAVVRSFGGAHTEVWPAFEWPRFKEVMHDMSGMMGQQS